MKSLYAQIMAFKGLLKRQKVPKKVQDLITPRRLESMGPIPPQHNIPPHAKQQWLQAQAASAARERQRQAEREARQKQKAPKVYKRGPYKKRKKPAEDDFESQLNALRELAGTEGPKPNQEAGRPAASAEQARRPAAMAAARANGNPAAGSASSQAAPKLGRPPQQKKTVFYPAGPAGISARSGPLPSQVYDKLIQGRLMPLAPEIKAKPSLVEFFPGIGNAIGADLARKATATVTAIIREEAECRRDRAVEGAIAELDAVVARKRRARVRPSEVIAYSIQSKALKLRKFQKKLRQKVLREQLEMQVMKTKEFYKLSRQLAGKKIALAKQAEADRKELQGLRHMDLRRGRQTYLDMVASNQDKLRSSCKRLMQFHQKLSGDYNKVEKEDRRKRMLRALEEKDAEAYATLVREGVGGVPTADKNELEQLTKFLDDTENYLKSLGDKVKLVKLKSALDEGDLVMAERMTKEEDDEERAGNKLYDAAHSVEGETPLPHLLSEPGLRSYQVTGLKWMLSLYKNRLNGILADEMGLGKTVQVISLLAWLMEYKSNMGPHLIIVPNAVVPNWRNEINRWFPTATVCVYVGNKEVRNGIFASKISLDATYRSNIVITTYEFTLRDRSKLAKVDWKYVVMDEAHRIKDRTSKLADAVDRLQSERRLLLTGTPLQNDLAELWSLLNYLLPDVFDDQSKAHFREWFDDHLSNQDQEVTQEKLAKRAVVIQRLHQALEPFMLRRQVEDVEQNLPPKVAHTILCALSSVESVAYRWLSRTSALRDLRGGSYAINNKAMELKKLCNHLVMAYPEAIYDHSIPELIRTSGKLFMLDRILVKMYKSGHRVLLFSTMTKALDILQTYVKWRGWAFHRIDGTTPIEEREEAIQDFNNVDNRAEGSQVPFIFLLSIRAAGRGLNLQSADTVVLYDPDPNPKNEEQAIARSHRIGQVKEVRVFHMECVVDMEVPTISAVDGDGTDYQTNDVEEKQGRGGYRDSVESIIRKEIQKYKIDMANEVIDAGRFDLESSHEEKRKTLQTYLQEHTHTTSDNYVVGMREVNRLLARSDEEIRMFDQLDKDEDLWSGSKYTSIGDVPSWLQFTPQELEAALPNK